MCSRNQITSTHVHCRPEYAMATDHSRMNYLEKIFVINYVHLKARWKTVPLLEIFCGLFGTEGEWKQLNYESKVYYLFVIAV